MDFKSLFKRITQKRTVKSSVTDNKEKALTIRKKRGKESYITIENRDTVKPEKYYSEKARVFGFARYGATALLVVFILVMFSFFGKEFTGENFRYLLKHIDMNSSGVIDEFKTVVYDSAEGTVFCEYQQDFVIAAPGSLKIYDYKGVMTLNSLPSTTNPRIDSSDRYILLYDKGDKDYYVYNSFSLLRQRDMESNIIMGDISHSGTFVVVTESLEYAAHIYVYNDNFELINEIKKNKTVSGVKLSDDGKRLAVTSFEISDNAEFLSTLTIYSLEESKAVFEKEIEGELPVSIELSPDGGVMVMTDAKFRFYDATGNERTFNVEKSGEGLFSTSGKLCAYTATDGLNYNRNKLFVVDVEQKKEVACVSVQGKLKSLGVGGEYVYLLTEDSLYRIDKEGKIAEEKIESPVCIVVSPAGNVFVCHESRAELVKFE